MKGVYLVLIFCLYVSCQRTESDFLDVDSLLDGDHLNMERLNGELLNTGVLLSPVDLFFHDSLLYVSGISGDYNVRVLNQSGKTIGKIVKNGLGPDELSSVADIDFLNDSLLLVHDITTNQVKKFVLKFESDSLFLSVSEIVNFQDVVFEPIFLDNNRFVSTVFNLKPLNRLYLYDENGKFIKGFGNYPDFGQEIPITVLPEVFINRAATNSSRDKVVLAYEHTDLVEFYDLDLNLISRHHGPHFFLPTFELKDRNGHLAMVRKENYTKWAFSQVVANDEDIFLLYDNGDTRKKETIEEDAHYNTILAIDWEGNLKRKFALDHPITTFTVDWSNRTIYGLDRMSSEIYKFEY